jgi:hypothetical protein
MKVEEIKLAFETNIQFSTALILKQDADRINKAISDISSLRSQMKKVYSDALKNANTNYAQFGQNAKELGLDPNQVPEYKNFMSLQSKIDDAYYKTIS